MSMPHNPTTCDTHVAPRKSLRLHLVGNDSERNHLDGGWWPQSRDLAVEAADLVDHFPPEFGHITRIMYSRPGWEPSPRRIRVRRGYVMADPFLGDNAHMVFLRVPDRNPLHILVIPPDYTNAQGNEALLAAATEGNMHSASALLDTVLDNPEVDPADQWNDDGGNWWGAHPTGPSFQTSR